MKTEEITLKELEEKLGLKFKSFDLFRTALTHSSFANGKKGVQYNERLEFLGDSVLQLCITEYLYNRFTGMSEGELTRMRALIVCEASLFNLAKSWDLGKYLYMSRGEELTGGRERTSILADAVEAIIASIYLDNGIEAARGFIMENFLETITKASRNEIIVDFKTKLQERLQRNGDVDIRYEILKEEGPAHRRKFFSKVMINSVPMGYGVGYSKKESEQCAAEEALVVLEADCRHE
ncbi:MAG: ribonuclease [Firmicutes bacterium]|nr:ribonuclease [Bacillota bacterium]